MQIRRIRSEDNAAIAALIREVLASFGAVGEGYACADPEVDQMFETYQAPRSDYYIITESDRILGGGGVGPLKNEDESICELQKMYFLPELRGQGMGNELLGICLEKAQAFGYQKCYLETLPSMIPAQNLYKKYGFRFIENRMGGTGHSKCPVWMIKDL